MLCFQTDNRTSSKKIMLPVLLTQQFEGGEKWGWVVTDDFIEEVRLEFNLQSLQIWGWILKKTNALDKPQPSFMQHQPQASEAKGKKQKATSEIMSSCWFMLSTVLSILIWRNCWLGTGPSAYSVSLVYNVPCLVPTTHFIALKLQGLMDPAWPTRHPSFLPSWGSWTLSKRSKEHCIVLACQSCPTPNNHKHTHTHTHSHTHTYTSAKILKPLKSAR